MVSVQRKLALVLESFWKLDMTPIEQMLIWVFSVFSAAAQAADITHKSQAPSNKETAAWLLKLVKVNCQFQ